MIQRGEIIMIRKFLTLSFLLIIVLITPSHAKIKQAKCFADIAQEFTKADQDTLVVFDVDDVLIMPESDYRATHPFRTKWIRGSKKSFSKEQRQLLISIIWEHRKVKLVDPSILNILEDLKRRQIPTLALTAMYTGKFGRIEKIEDWRINELKGVGIDFSETTPIKKTIFLENLTDDNGTPLLKAGVILTGFQDKAKILEAVLQGTGYTPKSIIFIDDNISYLKPVQEMCNRMGISFLGIHFIGASLVPELDLDEAIEDQRFKVLETEHRWVTDEGELISGRSSAVNE